MSTARSSHEYTTPAPVVLQYLYSIQAARSSYEYMYTTPVPVDLRYRTCYSKLLDLDLGVQQYEYTYYSSTRFCRCALPRAAPPSEAEPAPQTH